MNILKTTGGIFEKGVLPYFVEGQLYLNRAVKIFLPRIPPEVARVTLNQKDEVRRGGGGGRGRMRGERGKRRKK